MSDSSDPNDYRSSTEGYISFAAHIFFCLFVLGLLVQSLYHFVVKKSIESHVYIRWLVILSLVADFVFCVMGVILSYLRVFSHNVDYNPCTVGVQIVPILALARISLYYFYLARYTYSSVYTHVIASVRSSKVCIVFCLSICTHHAIFLYRFWMVFSKTAYNLSTTTFKLMVVFIFLSFFLSTIYYEVAAIYANCDTSNSFYSTAPIQGVAIDAFWSIITCYFFCSRLMRIHKAAADPDVKPSAPNKVNSKMMALPTKLTILTMVSFGTTLLSVMLTFVIHNNLALTIDVSVNAVCLLLTFKFNSELYYKLCCSCEKGAAWCSGFELERLASISRTISSRTQSPKSTDIAIVGFEQGSDPAVVQ